MCNAYCLYLQDSDPVAIDAIATCYDDNSRPPPMTYKHIAAYLERVAAGERPEGLLTQHSGSTSGRNLSAVTSAAHGTIAAGTEQRAAAIQDIESRTLEQTAAVNSSAFRDRSNSSPLPPTEQQQLVGPDSWQLLFEGLHTSAAVSVSDSSLEFGSCSRLKPCEPRTFTVTNNMDHRLLVSVITPPWQDPMNQDAGTVQVFQVCRPCAWSTSQNAFLRMLILPYRLQTCACSCVHQVGLLLSALTNAMLLLCYPCLAYMSADW